MYICTSSPWSRGFFQDNVTVLLLGVPTLTSRGGPGAATELQGGVEYFLPVCFLLPLLFNIINDTTTLVFLPYSVDSKPVHLKICCFHLTMWEKYQKCMQRHCHETFARSTPSLAGLLVCWFSALHREVFSGYSGSPSPQKPPFDLICVNC